MLLCFPYYIYYVVIRNIEDDPLNHSHASKNLLSQTIKLVILQLNPQETTGEILQKAVRLGTSGRQS